MYIGHLYRQAHSFYSEAQFLHRWIRQTHLPFRFPVIHYQGGQQPRIMGEFLLLRKHMELCIYFGNIPGILNVISKRHNMVMSWFSVLPVWEKYQHLECTFDVQKRDVAIIFVFEG